MGLVISKIKEECDLNFLKRTPSHDNFLNNLNQVLLESPKKRLKDSELLYNSKQNK